MLDITVIAENILKILDKYGFLFIDGIKVTLQFSAIAVIGGVILGMLLTFMRNSSFSIGKFKPLSFIATAYIELIRGTPILLHLYVFYLFLSTVFTLTEFQAIALALIFNSAAYTSEIFRAGIAAVDKGQTEAARCLGLNQSQAMFKVVIPQAIKNVLPALCNEFIMLIKETSLASVFFVGDIMTQYKIVNSTTFLIIEPLLIIAAIYFILTFTLSKFVAIFERRLGASD